MFDKGIIFVVALFRVSNKTSGNSHKSRRFLRHALEMTSDK